MLWNLCKTETNEDIKSNILLVIATFSGLSTKIETKTFLVPELNCIDEQELIIDHKQSPGGVLYKICSVSKCSEKSPGKL